MKPGEYERKRKEWREWIVQCREVAEQLVQGNCIFTASMDKIEIAKKRLSTTYIYSWVERNHYMLQAALIRSLSEPAATAKKEQSRSLRRLLEQIKKNPQVISREWFRAEYFADQSGEKKEIEQLADDVFDSILSEASNRNKTKMQLEDTLDKDISELELIFTEIGVPISQYVLHCDSNPTSNSVQKASFLIRSVESLEKMCLKYELLLTQIARGTLKPVWLPDLEFESKIVWDATE